MTPQYVFLDGSDGSLTAYKDALLLYYNTTAKCPTCPKYDIVKSSGDGKLKMECKECNWSTEIVLPKVEDPYYESARVNADKVNSVYKMLYAAQHDDKSAFDDAKREYSEVNLISEDIDKIFKQYQDKKREISNAMQEDYKKMQELDLQRKEIYKGLDKNVSNEQISQIYKAVEEGKSVKQFNKDWVEWVKLIVEYKNIKREYDKKDTELQKVVNEQKSMMLVVRKPEVISSGTSGKKKRK